MANKNSAGDLTRRNTLALFGTVGVSLLVNCRSSEPGVLDKGEAPDTPSPDTGGGESAKDTAPGTSDPGTSNSGTSNSGTSGMDAGTGAPDAPPGDSGTRRSCVLSASQTEGPYFVDEKLNRSDIRQDPSNGTVQEGVPLRLKLTVSKVNGSACEPLAGATVDVWHANAAGLYSDEADNGTAGAKYLRGYQVTDESGAVSFTTIYPGWYTGRALHLHFKVRTFSASDQTTYEFTSQLYFEDAVTEQVLAQAPYARNGSRNFTKNGEDAIYTGPSDDGSVRRNSGELMLVKLSKDGAGYGGSFDVGVRIP